MNLKKLKEVLSIQTESYNQFRMFAYIIRQLKAQSIPFLVNEGNIYITKGEADNYPCVVAHMDTVHEIVEDLTVINVKGNLTGFNAVTMQQTGIGGDDKVGVYIALDCLQKFDNIKVVFFVDEEVGCNGSYLAIEDFFTDCSFILQCDRRGNNDFIINASGTELSGEDFQNDISNIIHYYGYGFNNGMMTDVMALKEIGIDCCVANIGCGYYNPHSYDEYVNIQDVANCLLMVSEIIETLGHIRYEHKPFKKSYTKESKSNVLSFDFATKIDLEYCDCCMEKVKPEQLTFLKSYNFFVCQSCIEFEKEQEKRFAIK